MRVHIAILCLGSLTLGCLNGQETSPIVTIAGLVDQTLAENPEIRFYDAEILAAKANRRQAGKLGNPELSLEGGRKSVRGTDASVSGVAWAASLAQPIEWPGRLALRKAIANSDIALAELGVARFKQALTAKVLTLAFSLALQQERSAAAEEVQSRLAALRDVLVQREPADVAPFLEAKVIEATALIMQKQAGDAALEMQKALLELNQLRGRRADSQLIVRRTEFSFPAYPSIRELIAQAAANNYELKARVRELEAQGLKVALARNERYPTFAVGPMVSQERAGDRETTGGLALSIPLPVWTTGKAAVDVAEARRLQAQASLFATQREVERRLTEAALSYEIYRQRLVGWKPDMVNSFKEAAARADRHYRLGALGMTTYVELQEKYLEAVEAINETKRSALDAAMTLEQLTGTTESVVKPISEKDS